MAINYCVHSQISNAAGSNFSIFCCLQAVPSQNFNALSSSVECMWVSSNCMGMHCCLVEGWPIQTHPVLIDLTSKIKFKLTPLIQPFSGSNAALTQVECPSLDWVDVPNFVLVWFFHGPMPKSGGFKNWFYIKQINEETRQVEQAAYWYNIISCSCWLISLFICLTSLDDLWQSYHGHAPSFGELLIYALWMVCMLRMWQMAQLNCIFSDIDFCP